MFLLCLSVWSGGVWGQGFGQTPGGEAFPPRSQHEQISGRPGAAEGASRRLLIRLPTPHLDARGELLVRPQVQVVAPHGSLHPNGLPTGEPTGLPGGIRPPGSGSGSVESGVFHPSSMMQPGLPAGELLPEQLPPPQGIPLDVPLEALPGEIIMGNPNQPLFGELLDETLQPAHHRKPGFLSRLLRTRRAPYSDRGIGFERVMLAPFELDITQPMNNMRFRFDNAYGLEFPDRAEFFWAKIGGRGPKATLGPPVNARVGPNEQVDYQDIRYMWEVGGPKVSVQTEVPIRFLDPEFFYNTAGLGDMSVTSKVLMLDGRRWQITQAFRTYMPTGSASHGLGTGHVSLEPGFLFRYMWSDTTYLHGEIKYWVPLGGDPNHSGQIFRWGAGISHLWYESDTWAIIPTFEMVSWTVLDGQKTGYFDFGVPSFRTGQVDGETTVNLYPGLRASWDSGGDLGLIEFGLQGGFTITETSWYSGLLRFEARFVY